MPGADQPHVHVLRSLADSRAIIAKAKESRRAVVLGASFIGLEVAAALRTRKIEVHVAAPDRRPLERVLGREFGDFIRAIHEEHGVVFHLEETPTAIDAGNVRLKGGASLPADLVVVGIGVRPRTQLAERAGLKTDRGVAVNEYLETSVPGIFAAGDIARWPDPHTGANLRIEHWVVAERQGQAAARNMLGQGQRFSDVPFFWSQHYDVPINYIGHAEKWDDLDIEGNIESRDCVVRYRRRRFIRSPRQRARVAFAAQ
jgi:NADPH-dependent 2,4-dienoyl-CoA reductase/sulfur reductase-like enzyme